MALNKKTISVRPSKLKVINSGIETLSFVYTDPKDPLNRFPVIIGIYPAHLVTADIRWPHDIERRAAEVPFNYSFTDGSIFEMEIFLNAFRGMRETDMLSLSGGDLDSIVAVSDLNDYPLTDGVWLMERRGRVNHVLAIPPGIRREFKRQHKTI